MKSKTRRVIGCVEFNLKITNFDSLSLKKVHQEKLYLPNENVTFIENSRMIKHVN